MQQPKPYFREFDGWWYVQVRSHGKRKQHKLTKGRDNEAEAWKQFHRLMVAPEQGPQAVVPVPSQSVVVLLDAFLGHRIDTAAEATVNWYRHFLTSFGRFVGKDLTLAELRPSHVTDWLRQNPNWSPSTKNGAVQTVRACFRWHWREGRVASYPLNGLKAPRKKRRETVFNPQQFDQILSEVKDERFAVLLRFLFLTGCRPQEATRACQQHVQLDQSRIVFPPSESKGQEYPRVIYLNDESKRIVAELLPSRKTPDDPLFVNARGKPWNRNSVRCRFRRLRGKIGSLCAYNLGRLAARRRRNRTERSGPQSAAPARTSRRR